VGAYLAGTSIYVRRLTPTRPACGVLLGRPAADTSDDYHFADDSLAASLALAGRDTTRLAHPVARPYAKAVVGTLPTCELDGALCDRLRQQPIYRLQRVAAKSEIIRPFNGRFASWSLSGGAFQSTEMPEIIGISIRNRRARESAQLGESAEHHANVDSH